MVNQPNTELTVRLSFKPILPPNNVLDVLGNPKRSVFKANSLSHEDL